jgi:hypothetical protein
MSPFDPGSGSENQMDAELLWGSSGVFGGSDSSYQRKQRSKRSPKIAILLPREETPRDHESRLDFVNSI